MRTNSFQDVTIRYDEAGDRSIETLREIELSHQAEIKYLRPGGVYWITGGMGGLGRIFARHLINQGENITVILTGRSALDEAGQQHLAELNEAKATVVYLPADVSVKTDVERVVQVISEEYGPLAGIIHSAGVIRDSFIINKTEAELEAVLAPKVTGLLNIDAVTQAEPLDFMALFSSMAGVLGNIGQADYAAANAFVDAFAHHRQALVEAGERSGRTLSINWPLWAEGGMAVDKQSLTLMKRQTGITPLTTGVGLQAFDTLMTSGQRQILVIAGQVNKVRRKLLANNLTPPQPPLSQEKERVDTQLLAKKVQVKLTKAVSELLKIKVEEIAEDENLSEFGFDSITLTELANKLNETYQLELMPTVFFAHSTLQSLSRYLVEHHADILRQHFQLKATVKPISSAIALSTPAPVTSVDKVRFRSTANQQDQASQTPQTEAVAIIGISGMLPGSPEVDTFWQNLVSAKDLITEIPPERWDWRTFYGDPHTEANKTKSKWGGFIDDVDKFDPAFFKISPREAELMDPQQRLFLQTVWHTIEDAGYAASQLAGTRTGIFVGVASNDYQELIQTHLPEIEGHSATGLSHSVLANRISYLLDIHGPSEPIDTACSSSLVAIHRAVEALHSGSCELAIAGGVNVLLTPQLHIAFSKAGMLAEDGRCKTFDQRANGYVRAEGMGAIFLKPLSQAQADGDYIYALIRGTAENHGGKAASLTAPNPKAQADLLVRAYQQADIDPTTVGYIEAHGTGTALGDPIEINGLKHGFAELYQQWQRPTPTNPHCGLGSVKSNIGHLETAAGIAGVLKVLQAMKHQTLPATINFTEQNPYIKLEDSPFYLVTETQTWPSLTDKTGQPLPRRAGVSSFGFGGANAHVVLEEYVNQGAGVKYTSASLSTSQVSSEGPQLIVLSAKNEERLREYAAKLLAFLEPGVDHKTESNIDRSAIEQTVRELVSEIIGVDPLEIEVEQPFEGYGLDPVQLSRLKTMVEERYHCELPIPLFSGDASVESV
ncbi:MAG: SDR family NAD(P)-dependent oxidoreductase, partial [Gammaproteobacteria bacterium]|nr:SDR family NAD(P)-dependent oxidoreductase [Gammaproteobacteria bacterium]